MSNNRLSKTLVTIAAMALAGPAAAYTTFIADLSPTAHAFTGDPNNTVMQSATLAFYPGAGVTHNGESTGSPQHSLDNDGVFEFIRIDFGAGNSAILDKVITSWVQNDADITVLARTGNAGSPNPNGKTIAGPVLADRLANNGWELVGHFNSTSSADVQEIDVNSSGTAARYWLIGAYDPDFGGNANGANHGYGKYDYLKILKVKWDKPSDAAEPTTLLLFAAGFIAWLSSRRRTARI